jgi:HlyD family secretion protein
VNVVLDPQDPVEAWASLGDGFAVEVEITIWSMPDVVQVPTSAIFRQGAGWAVFAVNGRRAVIRGVTIGHRGTPQTEIVGGLAVDETVIIHPGASVHEGASVAFR